jgi:hypothetical protein
MAAADPDHVEHIAVRSGRGGGQLGTGHLLRGRQRLRTAVRAAIDQGDLASPQIDARRRIAVGGQVASALVVGQRGGPTVAVRRMLVDLHHIVDARRPVARRRVAGPLAAVDGHGQSVGDDLQIEGVIMVMPHAEPQPQIRRAAKSVIVVLPAGFQDAGPHRHHARRAVKPRCPLLRGRRLLDLRPVRIALVAASQVVPDHESKLRIFRPLPPGAGETQIAQRMPRPLVRSADIADAEEIAAGDHVVQPPIRVSHRLRIPGRVRQVVLRIAPCPQVQPQRLGHAQRTFTLSVIGRSHDLGPFARTAADHHVADAGDRQRIDERPREQPLHPRIGRFAVSHDRGQIRQIHDVGVVVVAHDPLGNRLHQIDVDQPDHVSGRLDPRHEPPDRIRQWLVVANRLEQFVVLEHDRSDVHRVMRQEVGFRETPAATGVASVRSRIADRVAQVFGVVERGKVQGVTDQRDRRVVRIVRIAPLLVRLQRTADSVVVVENQIVDAHSDRRPRGPDSGSSGSGKYSPAPSSFSG